MAAERSGRPLLDFDAFDRAQYTTDAATVNIDGWYSAITGIGTATNDKRVGHSFGIPRLTYDQCVALWTADDMARTLIEKPIEQALRQGYEFEIADEGKYTELKNQLEEFLLDLEVDYIIQRAMCMERALGGSAILLGVNDNRPLNSKLIPERVKDLEWLKVLEPIELTPYKLYDNPNKPKYGEVELWQLTEMTRRTGVLQAPTTITPSGPRLIHESRLIIFEGVKTSVYRSASSTVMSWGDSILLPVVETLRDFNVAWHAAGIIATDFSQAVISIENLMGLVARDKEKLRLRMEAIELGRSVARAVILDTKETYNRQTTSLAGLAELLEKISRRFAAAAGIPLSILMGAGEMGIGKDGLSDVRHYYDYIVSIQRRRIAPVLRRIINLKMGALRKRGLPTYRIKFHPLWQLTDEEKANARLAQARVDVLYADMMALSPNEIRDSRFRGGYSFDTQIDESMAAMDMKAVIAAAEEERKALITKATSAVTVAPHGRSAPTNKGKAGGTTPKVGGAVAGRGSATRDAARKIMNPNEDGSIDD